jgi:branched-chain amino acid transport system ATP-binding protein
LLELHEIDVFYGDVQVLYKVSFQVKEGKIVSLLGSNGAGKTTTLKTISGALHPLSGGVQFEGMVINKIPSFKIVELGVIQVPEGRKIFSLMTILENLELGSYSSVSRKKRNESLESVFSLFPILKERRFQIAGTLSGGEQQMLAIGRGLMSLPKLLMLDEPSLGLAPLVVKHIFETIKKVNEIGTTILLVEQNVKAALLLSEWAYILENGRITLAGTANDLMNQERVRKAYMGI